MDLSMKALRLFCSSRVGDLQSMETVVEPLNDGIISICYVCKHLLEAQVDPNTGMCFNYGQIRRHIEHAEQYITRSEKTIKVKLQNLDEHMEQLIKEKGNAEQQRRQKHQTKNELHIEKDSAEESLDNSREALEQAKKNVASAKKEIEREKLSMIKGGVVAVTGVGVTLIPVAGWVLGPMIVYDGLSTIGDAIMAMKEAEDDLEENESRVGKYRRKVSDYQSMISKIESEIEETDELLDKIQSEIEEVKQHLDYTADIQEMVRKAVNLLSVVSGRVTALERQTRRFILWEPVIKVMEEVMEAVTNVVENRLLYSHGVAALMRTLRENVGELLALCSSPKHSEYEEYY
ncbi:uncharacterized protein LOC130243573 [Danio aesculapii]|uniref:uncharacterized protein LOC130243573 n=1 Tax=Danio aesculapii TaxID=1142201 RepID=UPI0024C0D004|nr:uncharacterized protein LOC130243573 [Danio aesculapii]